MRRTHHPDRTNRALRVKPRWIALAVLSWASVIFAGDGLRPSTLSPVVLCAAPQIQTIRNLTADQITHRDQTRLVKRATILHNDAAIYVSNVGLDSQAQTKPGDPQTTQPTKPVPWLENMKAWLKVVAAHKPGQMDLPARLMVSATEEEFDGIRVDFLALVNFQRRESERRGLARPLVYKNTTLVLSDIQELLGLTDEEAARGDATRILRRAGVLHGDVAMMTIPGRPAQAGCSAQSVVIVKDGQRVGAGCRGIHWVMARALLDAIKPDPKKDPVVRLWYQATIGFLLEQRDYADGGQQIDEGSRLFPDDPDLLFERGYLHETFASPNVQPAVRASKTDIRSPSAHLKEAEELFRRALESIPDFVEARLHHGVVLGALGRHEEAAGELRKAAATAAGPVLRYYAELFLGDQEQDLGRSEAARAAYTKAAALFPSAQAPRLALSALARRNGDRVEALDAIRYVLDLPAADEQREDPWLTYPVWLNESAGARLSKLYRSLLVGSSP